MGFNSALKG